MGHDRYGLATSDRQGPSATIRTQLVLRLDDAAGFVDIRAIDTELNRGVGR